ncbi:hypothetical protein Pcinc_032984 [Petrolisthes cinctipes]|uniref:Uncharacterized protein n=1 Tax=Petrolisthes cinctipes TaxID=88211 RepID=A0AAE1ETB7_PETCI|nr:hypothetical protein Pcinc_032984 [Petrolisthes cinctipes]
MEFGQKLPRLTSLIKRVLDKFLKSDPDKPKMPHYNIRALTNCILDQLPLVRVDGNFITLDSPSSGPTAPVCRWGRTRVIDEYYWRYISMTQGPPLVPNSSPGSSGPGRFGAAGFGRVPSCA